MSQFPRTQIEDLSVPRLLVGCNWFLGYSHTTAAQSRFVKEHQTRERIADILEVFFRAGIDATLGGRVEDARLNEAVREAEQRSGRAATRLMTPGFDLSGTPGAHDKNLRMLDAYAALGCRVCMPHQSTTDALVNRRTRRIEGIEPILAAIRERGMVPGLSTHMPETPVYADETGIDVATYIQIYNAAGFLMQIEVDWIHRMIWQRRKPVITIKPLAAGRLHPLVGLAFNWATLRDVDMVCVGCFTPDEAREVVDLSLALLERRAPQVALQETRSKESMK